MNQPIHTVAHRKQIRRRSSLRCRMRFLFDENAPVFALRLAEILLFFFLSLSECFELPSPFAACATGAYVLAGKKLLFPFVGMASSLFLRIFWQVETDLWQYIGCALLMPLALRPPKSVTAASVAVTAALSLRLFALIFSPTTQKDMVLCTVSLLVGALCTPAFCHVVSFSQKQFLRMQLDDLLCCLVLCAVFLSGAGRVVIGPVNVGFLIAGYAILISSSISGCTAAVTAGLICGISLSLCGHADGYTVCLAFSGIVCGLLYGHKRGILCGVYLLCCAFASYAVHFMLDIGFILSALIACTVFLFTPQRMLTTAFAYSRRFSAYAADNEAAYAQYTRSRWTNNLFLLSQLLPEIKEPIACPQQRLDEIMERMCAGCDQAPICWNDRADETQRILSAYFSDHDRSAVLGDCPRLQAWPALALDFERAAQQQSVRTAYAKREREATRTHLFAIAQAMSGLTQEHLHCDKDNDALLGEASYLLKQLHLAGRILFALRISQHICIALQFEPPFTRQKQIERYCSELSARLNRPLHITQRSKDTLLIEEAPDLCVECFHLSAAAGDSDGENGDSVLVRAGRGGTEAAMLSDGMGHGSAAHEESEKTLELLSLCLDSGYSVEAALAAINCIMLSATDGEQYATVDLCISDLWAQRATLYKLGSCPSVLISCSSIRTVNGCALPLGILPDVRASSQAFPVADGDVLIQFTDGLSDACGGMKTLENQISLLVRDKLHRLPETVCTRLMSFAMRRCGGVPPDDMTILCTLFKSTKK